MGLAERIILFCWTYIFPILVVIYLLIVLYEFLLHERRTKRRAKYLPVDTEEIHGSENVKVFEWDDSPSISKLEKPRKIPYAGATATLDRDPLQAASKFYEIVRDRRSVREFSSKSVDLAIIERCILAAGTGPSPSRSEPYTFCVVSDKGIKEQIHQIIESGVRDSSQQMDYLTVAPHLVLIFVETTYGGTADYDTVSTSIAAGIFLCALQAAGLNSLVTTTVNCGPALRTLVGRPVSEKLLFLLPVGYAAEDCKVSVLKRKPVEEIMTRDFQ